MRTEDIYISGVWRGLRTLSYCMYWKMLFFCLFSIFSFFFILQFRGQKLNLSPYITYPIILVCLAEQLRVNAADRCYTQPNMNPLHNVQNLSVCCVPAIRLCLFLLLAIFFMSLHVDLPRAPVPPTTVPTHEHRGSKHALQPPGALRLTVLTWVFSTRRGWISAKSINLWLRTQRFCYKHNTVIYVHIYMYIHIYIYIRIYSTIHRYIYIFIDISLCVFRGRQHCRVPTQHTTTESMNITGM